MTFTTTNWATEQTVTVKAGDDDNADNESETLTHTALGGDYVNVTKDLPVSITDDEVPVTVSVRVQANYDGRRGRPGLGDGHFERGPRAHGGHSHHTYARRAGRTSPADYSVPQSVTFDAGADVADHHLHGGPGRRGRRRGERAARLRDAATAGRGEPGHDDHRPR